MKSLKAESIEKPCCPKCKTSRWVQEDIILVYLDLHMIWRCVECSRVLETIREY